MTSLPMVLSNKGFIQIASFEGLCLRPYYDSVGVITIGFGSTKTEIPDLANWDKSKYVTIDYCVKLFQTSLVKYAADVNSHLTATVNQEQFDALVSIAYNIGSSGEDHSTFLKDINNHIGLPTIRQAILMWNKPPEIIGRRTKEANLYCDGIYSSSNMIELEDTDGKGHQLASTIKLIDISQYI